MGAPLFSSHAADMGLNLGLETGMLAMEKVRPQSVALAFLSLPVTTAGAQPPPQAFGGHL